MREVRNEFSSVLQAVVQQASTQSFIYSDTIIVLSTCPFSWHEERCLVRSGLMFLLDKLCCSREREENDQAAASLSAMAWAGFQVLIGHFVQWEGDKGACCCKDHWKTRRDREL